MTGADGIFIYNNNFLALICLHRQDINLSLNKVPFHRCTLIAVFGWQCWDQMLIELFFVWRQLRVINLGYDYKLEVTVNLCILI